MTSITPGPPIVSCAGKGALAAVVNPAGISSIVSAQDAVKKLAQSENHQIDGLKLARYLKQGHRFLFPEAGLFGLVKVDTINQPLESE